MEAGLPGSARKLRMGCSSARAGEGVPESWRERVRVAETGQGMGVAVDAALDGRCI
jgi:hypothetical protein